MIKGNVIYFGFGTIAVGASVGKISFTHVSPAIGVGAEYERGKVENLQVLEFYPSYEDYKYLLESAFRVEGLENRQIIYKDYVFDFNNYEPKSLDVFVKAVGISLVEYLRMCLDRKLQP